MCKVRQMSAARLVQRLNEVMRVSSSRLKDKICSTVWLLLTLAGNTQYQPRESNSYFWQMSNIESERFDINSEEWHPLKCRGQLLCLAYVMLSSAYCFSEKLSLEHRVENVFSALLKG